MLYCFQKYERFTHRSVKNAVIDSPPSPCGTCTAQAPLGIPEPSWVYQKTGWADGLGRKEWEVTGLRDGVQVQQQQQPNSRHLSVQSSAVQGHNIVKTDLAPQWSFWGCFYPCKRPLVQIMFTISPCPSQSSLAVNSALPRPVKQKSKHEN